jgi:ankyrin repeat protein
MSSSLFPLFYKNDVAKATALLSRNGLQKNLTATGSAKDQNAGKLGGKDINKRDRLGRTVLHLAAAKGSLDFVKALLENPATDVDIPDTESGW